MEKIVRRIDENEQIVEKEPKEARKERWIDDPDNQMLLFSGGAITFMAGVVHKAVKTIQLRNILNFEQYIDGYRVNSAANVSLKTLKRIIKERKNGKSTYEILNKMGLLAERRNYRF